MTTVQTEGFVRKAPEEEKASHLHGKVERRIVWNLIHVLQDAGFKILTVFDSGEYVRCKGNAKAAYDAIFAVDEAHLFVQKPGFRPHWIFFVLGNGEEVISNWLCGDDDDFETLLDGFKPEENY